MRVAPLIGDGVMVVVAGTRHRHWVLEQRAVELQDRTQILLEPEARDSAAAMAAAAAWTLARDPQAVNVFVASDHHVPDHEAFRAAVREAAAAAAADGRIVTLGVKPTSASTAYGYINPEGPGLAAVKAFREKPDRDSAAEFIRDGYLWNSGNFIVSAATLTEELEARAPGVADAARRSRASALRPRPGARRRLSKRPKISIDYAVMEKTLRASVLAVDFAWSDLGAWDAIAETGEGEFGSHIFEDSEGCLVRAPEGVLVGVLGSAIWRSWLRRTPSSSAIWTALRM